MLPKNPDARLFQELKLFQNLTSFQELEERLESLREENQKDSAFALFVEGLLATRYFAQATDVLPLLALNTEIRNRLSLPEKLDGASGYFRTANGYTTPYALHYSPNREALTPDSLASFQKLLKISEQPLLVSNTLNLPKELSRQDGFHRLLAPDLDRLTPADFSSLNRWLKGGGIVPTRNSPSPAQNEALKNIRDLNCNRAILVSPIGGDMLQTVRVMIESLGSQRTGLIVLPSQNHIKDLIHHWQTETSWSTIAPLIFSSQPSKLKQSDLDYPVTDNSSDLRNFFNLRIAGGVKLIIATADVLSMLQRAILGFPAIDLAIIMDAHRIATPQWERLNSTICDSELPIKKLYLLTTTPHRFDPLKANKDGELKTIFQLGTIEEHGHTINLGTLAGAIEKKTIRPWKFLLPVIGPNDDILEALKICVEAKPEISHIHSRHEKPAAATSFAKSFAETCPEQLKKFIPCYVDGLKNGAEADQQLINYQKQSHAILSLATTPDSGFNLNPADLVFFIKGSKLE
ncbi:MAG: hypothetical protein HQL70_05070, partial [Magnetococcales bacterium]|nr:hypothetical protein [Magnetococcales bacterium]